jgi:hypothetical protein
MRRAGASPTLRVNVRVSVGTSGTVTRVVPRGGSFGNLNSCIERAVRQWRFPRASAPSTFDVPFVFQGSE